MTTVYGDYPVYYKQPIRWLRYHAHTRPHLYYSVVLGLGVPALALILTPLRRRYLYPDHEVVPNGYPLPKRKRDLTLQGYDD
ncbi:hypothetical protein WICANDRAFT_69651 [Wickerhamomyces anomalus NRRL Y-366-8]|uniref:NADH-ubiquinone oxidoreductase 9.5 kDa subunit n=1 Tax=Wickerhamomyces anomalus (strain ATCC 58044 / CBS 1984 / NCYC 433 / NRRL Y-366-8) TaxID=683960 RepID=A0A1E3P1D2_WICAA|nr:uncharacterized protein WICANDRAFT_69651 [Wickerhamomyces anomalus NRRL Y-366-8]ODQ59289.1 hypothetical protein WICANDRAFT_69651 [Wickerhamomyces anomalus NRRL Y-366-8]